MTYECRPCELEIDFTSYVQFLIAHHAELNLPYSFAQKLSFVSSPLMFGKGLLIYEEELYRIVGAAGFVYGTGSHEYENRDVCQVETVFIENDHRHPFLFVRAMQELVRLMKAGNPDVRQVQFWTSADAGELDGLLAKFTALPGAARSEVQALAYYQIPFHELETFCGRFRDAR
ncbi:hypothetical protein WMW72_06770 [Paenibacillus filicis]|uniref:Uncharacterized protein n=1 Tax=Paenibacillus filicis TaxID=669464 RepID=A0ABU9DHH4_9BACL